MTEADLGKRENDLKVFILEPGFLPTIVEAARIYGNSGDSVETRHFVQWLHDVVGQQVPELTPYDQEIYDL